MTIGRVAVLAMKMLGLFIALEGFKFLLGSLEIVVDLGLRAVWGTGLASAVLVIGLGLAIWVKADPLAARALGEPAEVVGEPGASDFGATLNLSGLDAYAIAFTVLGVFLLVQALIHAAGALGL